MTPIPHTGTLTRTILLTGLALSSVIIASYLFYPSFIRFLNYKTTDVIMALSNPKPASGDTVIVDLDEKSLSQYGQWPWPRHRLSHLLQRVNELGATSIGLDLILAEPDRTSPRNWQSEVGRELGYQIDTSNIPAEVIDHDRYLTETLALGPFVLGYEFLFKPQPDTTPKPPCGLHPLNVVWIKNPISTQMRTCFFKAHQVVCNRQMFSEAVSYAGFLNATPDLDGILRRIPLLIQFDDQLFPSFALAVLMQSKGLTQVHLIQEKNGFLKLIAGNSIIPIDRQGNVIVNFSSGTDVVHRVSAADVLGGVLSPDRLKDKLVLIGSSASGLKQIYQTPGKPVSTHVDVHAQLLENLITGQVVIRSHVFLLWEALLGVLIATLLCVSIAKMEILGSAMVGGLCLCGVWLGMETILRTNGLLFSPFLPTVLILTNYTILTILKTWKNQHHARRRVEDTLYLLKASEKNLNSIITTIPDIVFRLDTKGRITFISSAISKYSHQPETLIGQSIFNLVPSSDRPKAQYRLNEKRTGVRATCDLELQLLLPHNPKDEAEGKRYFSVSAEGIYSSDTPDPAGFMGTQGIIKDITEQKKIEDQLLQAQKMEVVGSLAAGIAHDLNNILIGVVSYPDLLLMELPEDSPLRNRIITIQQSGQKAAAIVQDLLTLARRGVKISELINLNTIISEYLKSPEYNALKHAHPQIKIQSHMAPDLLNIKGSPVHFSKVLMNLLHNAAEAMPAGGRILLSTFNRYLDTPRQMYEEVPTGEYVCLRLDDEGVGINSEDLKKIFDPFYTKKMMQKSGSGLGMTVIWATIKDHAGYIDVQSKEGEGTQIDIYLPATRELADDKPRRMTLEEYIGTEHILIVDDMPDQIEIAVKMLARLGYKVSSVSSGEAAVDFMQKDKADLVVLDMMMPDGIDGLETYRRIIAIHPHQKAIIASGFSESERVKTLQNLGAGPYIQKPYTLEKIGVAIRKELDR